MTAALPITRRERKMLDELRAITRESVGGRPRLLDLFCGAGGAAMGYHRAGFSVVGVDIKPQPNYPFEFVEADALDVLSPGTHFGGYVLSVQFDAIHASPPCQEYSSAGKASKVTNGSVYADLYGPTRGLLGQTGVPWAIENVTAAPSRSGILLCGSMFGLPIVRHRIFETSHLILSPFVCDHVEDAITVTGHSPQRWLKGARKTVPKSEYETAMGIDWMKVSELVQAVPPAYTEFIGDQLLQHVRRAAA